MRKKRISLVLALVLSVCLAIPAMARNISEFPPQNRDFFYPNYTGCLQSLLYYYHSTTRKKIVDSGGIDKSYGPGTAEAVKVFQGRKGLDKDGKCGPLTWKALHGCLVNTKTEGYYEFYKLNGVYNTNCIKYNTGSGLWYSYYGDKWNYVGN